KKKPMASRDFDAEIQASGGATVTLTDGKGRKATVEVPETGSKKASLGDSEIEVSYERTDSEDGIGAGSVTLTLKSCEGEDADVDVDMEPEEDELDRIYDSNWRYNYSHGLELDAGMEVDGDCDDCNADADMDLDEGDDLEAEFMTTLLNTLADVGMDVDAAAEALAEVVKERDGVDQVNPHMVENLRVALTAALETAEGTKKKIDEN
ncbi:MAG: hypothetical protein ABII71_04990, partial [Candidatus Micrarchaeota archaeon]